MADKQIELPPERTKNGQPHIVPLSDQALSILREIDMSDRTWVFGRNLGSPFSGFSKGKTDLDAEANVEAWTIHDLRRTAATRMGDEGVLPHVVEAVLNQISGSKAGVAGTYNKASYPERETRGSRIAPALRGARYGVTVRREHH